MNPDKFFGLHRNGESVRNCLEGSEKFWLQGEAEALLQICAAYREEDKSTSI